MVPSCISLVRQLLICFVSYFVRFVVISLLTYFVIYGGFCMVCVLSFVRYVVRSLFLYVFRYVCMY